MKKAFAQLLIVILFVTTGCTGAFQSINSGLLGNQEEAKNPHTNGDIPIPGINTGELATPGGNEEVQAIPGQKTLAVVSANRVLMSMINCLGTESPTEGAQNAQAVWEEKKGSFSVEGKANTLTSPMMMAATSLAAEVCVDAIRIESNLPVAQRRLFPQIDFSRGPSSVNAADLADSVRRISRSCWGRNETDSERTAIVNEANAQFNGNSNEETRRQALYVCTSMMSSLSALEL